MLPIISVYSKTLKWAITYHNLTFFYNFPHPIICIYDLSLILIFYMKYVEAYNHYHICKKRPHLAILFRLKKRCNYLWLHHFSEVSLHILVSWCKCYKNAACKFRFCEKWYLQHTILDDKNNKLVIVDKGNYNKIWHSLCILYIKYTCFILYNK